MPNPFPWFPFYAADWKSGVDAMSAEQRGVYISMLVYQWENGAVPLDRATVARFCGSPKLRESTFAAVRAKFEPVQIVDRNLVLQKHESGISTSALLGVNKRLEEVRAKAANHHKSLSDNGKRGADARLAKHGGGKPGLSPAQARHDARLKHTDIHIQNQIHTPPPSMPLPSDNRARARGGKAPPAQDSNDASHRNTGGVVKQVQEGSTPKPTGLPMPSLERIHRFPHEAGVTKAMLPDLCARQHRVTTEALTTRGLTEAEADDAFARMVGVWEKRGMRPTDQLETITGNLEGLRDPARGILARIANAPESVKDAAP